jgi:hypothetical protein
VERADQRSREELLELQLRQIKVIGRQQEELAAREPSSSGETRRGGNARKLLQFRRPVKTPESASVSLSPG